MTANPYVAWALAPLSPSTRVAVVAGRGAAPGDVELVAAEVAQVLDGALTDPAAAALVVRAHRGAATEPTAAELAGWPQAQRIATWSVEDRVVAVVPVRAQADARRRAQAAHLLRVVTVRGRGLRRRWVGA